jgi:folate-binding protein YgfZ
MSSQSAPLIEYLETLGYKVELNSDNNLVRNYNNTAEALRSLYEGVGLRNISHSGIIELRGNDVLDFIHRIATNDVKDLPKEGIADTIFTTEKGRIIDRTSLLNFESHYLLVCSNEHKQKVLSWINKYTISDDVKAVLTNGKYNLFELLGPQADSFATLICGNIVSNIQPNSFKIIHTEGLLFFLVKIRNEAGNNKFWIIADEDNARRLTKYMVENKGLFDFNFIGEDAYNIYRIENGIPAAPNEINSDYNPHETRLMYLVSSTKGCYIGQEVIARLETYDKVQKLLTGFEFTESPSPDAKFLLFDENNKEAGEITSFAYSYKLNKYIGLGFVKKSFLEEEAKLTAKDQYLNTIQVVVKKLPFKK